MKGKSVNCCDFFLLIDTTKAYVNRVIKKKEGVLNNTFIRIMEALGYDVELTYVKREED